MTEGGETMIRIAQVSKVYRQGSELVHALCDVSMSIAEGEFLSLVGPSGSGKSTLLHLIAGLELPDSGSVVIGGRTLGDLSDDELTVFRRRNIGMVFQSYNLLPTLTVEENVALPLLLDHKQKDQVAQAVCDSLEVVGLVHRRYHRPDTLSGGEMQRTAIARALAPKPAILLADEPTGNLDPKARDEILTFIQESSRAMRQTVVMVTHDLRAAAFSRRIVALTDGRISG